MKGICVAVSEQVVDCDCYAPYVDSYGRQCVEKGKSKKTAFLCSLIVGFLGVDRFYLSAGDGIYVFAGCVKFCLLVVFPLLCLCFCLGEGQGVLGKLGVCGAGLMPAAAGVWWLADWCRILTGHWDMDGQGLRLYQDM